MAFAEQIIDSKTYWITDNGSSPYGLVSLFDVKKFYGVAFCALTGFLARTQMLCETAANSQGNGGVLDGATLKEIAQRILLPMEATCEATGLVMSLAYIARIRPLMLTQEYARYSEVQKWMETLQERIEDELGSELLFHVSRDKAYFCNYATNGDLAIAAAFPSSIIELCAAGRCVSYGEGTACVFHLMRVIDSGLRSVATSLSISYDARNWGGIAKAIDVAMDKKYQSKSQDWRQSEPFYASILTDIQAISRGHRNPVLHELEKKYTDAEAEYLFTVTEGFMLHLANNGMKENL